MICHINEWIEKRGYKKKWVADQLGVSNEVLSRWVNGRSMPSVEKLFKLAEILNCKVDDLYETD
ncbi:helix-turn-helix domain-containing protein [Terrihalobacillus insolitus]|uniref:helix-turn-helix domain-containing protein n=1 Tax=Terrihalobacillus insolitus TaxID=2950438 RepID=UPI002342538E|nr:helix-turn-helix transcriptional regulator [Terrihalobacillus insolitus]MDC3412505.1 helix-turn-helix transcriptional regulator [Terrihalobacillus insolitus]